MTTTEFWMHFTAAMRNGTSLRYELTRIHILDIPSYPEDWTTMFTVSDIANRFGFSEHSVHRLIEDGILPHVLLGSEPYVTLGGIKELLNFDESRLHDVPWEEVVDKFPEGIPETPDRRVLMHEARALQLIHE